MNFILKESLKRFAAVEDLPRFILIFVRVSIILGSIFIAGCLFANTFPINESLGMIFVSIALSTVIYVMGE